LNKIIARLIILSAIILLSSTYRAENEKIGPLLASALSNPNENSFIVWLYLKDKGPNANQMLSNPLGLVTQKSIERRLKVRSPENVVDIGDVPLNPEYVKDISAIVNKTRVQAKWINALSVEMNREQLSQLTELPYVVRIELVERYRRIRPDVEKETQVKKPEFYQQQNPLVDSFNYGNSFTQISQINVHLVHNQAIWGQGVTIASFDDGWKNQTHQVFTTLPMQVAGQYDFQLNLPYAGYTTASHGTNTLSNVGGYFPGQLIGPAFRSKFLVARTEVDSFERPIEMDSWNRAAQWADSLGADVITSSLGYLGFDFGYPSYSWMDMNGNIVPVTIYADLAADRGIVVVNSAGNGGSSTHNTLSGPADGDSVIAVGAVTSAGVRSGFSSIGPTTDAPPRIKPDVMAMGEDNYIALGTGTNSYGNSSGTSFSCPLAAGVAALILSANKSLTPMQVRALMRRFAGNSSFPNNFMGWGILNAKLSVDSARKMDNSTPVIQHTQPFSNTNNTGVITISAKITDNGIIRNWSNEAPRLYFRKSSNNGSTWTSYTAVNAISVSSDSFYFQITGTPAGWRVEYYLAAQDIALPVPRMATLPAGGSGINPPGTTAPPTKFMYTVDPIGIEPISTEIPIEFKLYQNYPNPFNPVTKIRFAVPPVETGLRPVSTRMMIYDALGREVTVLVNDVLPAGIYEVVFDGTNFPGGVYYVRFTAGESYSDVKKLVLLK
jgi:serine protease AprX